MGKKPVIRDNAPEEEVQTETMRGSLVKGLASKADLDNFENRITMKAGGMIVAMAILVILVKAL